MSTNRSMSMAALLIVAAILLCATPSASAATAAGGRLYDSLASVQYLNEGIDLASNSYTIQAHGGLFYTEPQNVTSGYGYSWDDSTLYYPYLLNTSSVPVNSTCKVAAPVSGDRPGGDLLNFVMPSLNTTLCGITCCASDACVGYVVATAPATFQNCPVGQPCCYLKSGITAIVKSDTIVNALVDRPMPKVLTPPVGIRSAVPLGGVSCGSIELRGDGRFHEWTIINQSPGGSPKFGVVDDAIMAVRVNGQSSQYTKTATIRTRPPHGLPGVQALRYRGSYPVTRLDIIDGSIPVDLSVYAYSVFKPGDLNRSVTPAIVFSLNAFNPTAEAMSVSFMLSLPFSNEPDTIRPPATSTANVLRYVSVQTPTDCMSLCDQLSGCASWSLTDNNCTLQQDVPPNNYHYGSTSGVSGKWAWTQQQAKSSGSSTFVSPAPLTLNRPGYGPAAGNISLWSLAESASGANLNFSSSLGADNDLVNLFNQFASNGAFSAPASGSVASINGAASVTAIIPPGQRATLTIVFSWYFPHRDHIGYNGRDPKDALIIGNFYQNLFQDSADVVKSVATSLKSIVDDIVAMHSLYFDSSMTESLIDYLVNGVSHIRSAMYTASGQWRQWEAYDCADIDSVHNDYQRHMPYILYFPETEKQKIRVHAAGQQDDGMIKEELSNGCIGATPPWDQPGGSRVMGDVSSLFIAEIWQFYAWSNDVSFVQELWKNIRAATLWQINVSPQGLPEHLVCTYDILNLAVYPLCTFNSVLHLLAMKAAIELAKVVGDNDLIQRAQESYINGSMTLDNQLWYNNPGGIGYYQSYNGATEHALMADALYGQVVSYTLGLGPLIPIEKIRSHLAAEIAYNDGPYGLIVQTGREDVTNKQDNAIWTGGSQDWSALALRVFDDVDVFELMAPSVKGLNHMRYVLHDAWNTHGLVASDGYTDLQGGLPLCTAHYGFHMVLWHIPFSLSGQIAYMFNGTLIFNPVVNIPYTLPLLLPNILGTLDAHYATSGVIRYTLSLTFGTLTASYLQVSLSVYDGPVSLTAGDQISWIDKTVQYNNEDNVISQKQKPITSAI